MKTTFPAGAALTFAAFTLSACGGEPSEAPEAAPEGFPGVTVTDGRLVLPAVAGNPGAAYFTIAYDGDRIAVIRAASIEGAKSAMLHQTFEDSGVTSMGETLQVQLASGETLKFEPGGNHVMAMDLDEGLQPGGTTEITLTFLGGDKISFPAEVLAAKDAR